MNCQLNKNQLGLTIGTFLAIIHAVWALLVAIIPAGMQKFIDWILSLHFLSMSVKLNPFSMGNAIMLIIVTFLWGYVVGWVITKLIQLLRKQEEAK